MDLNQMLERCYSGAVYDVLRAMALPNQVLPSSIRPLNAKQKLTGRVFTVAGGCDVSAGEHESLLGWTGLLSKAPAQSVVVCQPNDSFLAHFGELSAEAMHSRGIRGYIVDGGSRDTQFIEALGFPVFCRYFTPKDIVGRWRVESLGEPITIGEVCICTADYVIADRDGIVIIPAHLAEEVVRKVIEVMSTENLVRKAIREGVDPQEAYLKYGKF
jgi:4-hydroxy-4-methyl-2-oxoglutarate aldolase